MSNILCIDTSESSCSVALVSKGTCIDEIVKKEPNSQTQYLTLMIQEILEKNQLFFKDLDAGCVISGPGSYTGLRIGVSTAKGICWANDIKLLALTNLEVWTHKLKKKFHDVPNPPFRYLVPSLDARRNEVFMMVSSPDKVEMEISPVVLDENPLRNFPDAPVVYAGSGASKFSPFLTNRDLVLDDLEMTASDMSDLAHQKFENKEFEDVAYFEPKYFKAVHTTVSKKKIFG